MNRFKVAYWVAVAAWFALVVALLMRGRPEPNVEVSEPVAQPEAPVVVHVLPKTIAVKIEGENTEAVPMERDPVRNDIPLDTETQMLLWQACEETGVSYELALAVIWKETTYRNIKGDGGDSYGFMQVQKRWHEERMERLGVTDLMDPYSNFLVGCDYLAELAEQDRGIHWMLHAYNGGPSYANELAKAGKVSQYAKNVLKYMNDLGGF